MFGNFNTINIMRNINKVESNFFFIAITSVGKGRPRISS